MIYIPMLLVLLFVSVSNAETIQFHYESKDDVTGVGVAIKWTDVLGELSASPFVLEPGFSFGMLDANTSLTISDRTTIYPVYVFLHASTDYIATPFFEAGIDVGDLIISETFENQDDNSSYDIDTYYSVGVKVALHKRFDIALYYKAYQLAYRKFDELNRHTVYPEVVGLSLSFDL